MTDVPNVNVEQVRSMTESVNLHLSDEALEALAGTYRQFLAGFEPIRSFDVGDREPLTVTFEAEESR